MMKVIITLDEETWKIVERMENSGLKFEDFVEKVMDEWDKKQDKKEVRN